MLDKHIYSLVIPVYATFSEAVWILENHASSYLFAAPEIVKFY
jgi:hypothetical protein